MCALPYIFELFLLIVVSFLAALSIFNSFVRQNGFDRDVCDHHQPSMEKSDENFETMVIKLATYQDLIHR